MKLVCYCSYLADQYPDEDVARVFAANKFIKAIKGKRTINGYAWVPIRDKKKKLEQSNRDVAIKWFGYFGADWLRFEDEDDIVQPPVALVPIPNSGATTPRHRPRTVLLAEAIAQDIHDANVVAVDALRWKRDLGSASSGGGTRDARTIHRNLQLIETPHEQCDIVLIDDVVTSCGHLQAVCAFFRAKGYRVPLAICAGRTVHVEELPQDCFTAVEEEVADWTP